MTGRSEYISDPDDFRHSDYEETGYESMDIGSYADDTDKEWKIVTHGTWYGTITIQKRIVRRVQSGKTIANIVPMVITM